MTPDLLILGQLTIDHVVPATPAPWFEALGGNALYAAAGARLWLAPQRIGVVARRGPNMPASIEALMRGAGLSSAGLKPVADDNLVEWMLYESDGSRRNVPRAPELRDLRQDAVARDERYLDRKAAISATADDIPQQWRGQARAIHLAPQVKARHPDAIAALAGPERLLSVDPSPTYSRSLTIDGLRDRLHGATILAPSQAEVGHLAPDGDFLKLAGRLAGDFAEVAIKLGERGVALAWNGGAQVAAISAAPADPLDFTGAGDAFCGAYLANRLLALQPPEAARRAVVAAAMTIECAGVDRALALDPAEARRRFAVLRGKAA